MKLMQHKYPSIKKLEIELRQLEEPITLPTRPCKYIIYLFIACIIYIQILIWYIELSHTFSSHQSCFGSMKQKIYIEERLMLI